MVREQIGHAGEITTLEQDSRPNKDPKSVFSCFTMK
jgi:hypothetical protein